MADVTVAEAVEMERRLAAILESLKRAVCWKVETEQVSKLWPIGGSSVLGVIALKDIQDWNISPGYYMPKAQADAVMEHVRTASTVSELLRRVDAIISDGKAKGVALNRDSVAILRQWRGSTA